jgi:DEAD/DEAH box helicase domain-containing protein|tara:strand:+ start:405 stop:998 length:594 start_codon:yes stop_codon:yes gene_type:complete
MSDILSIDIETKNTAADIGGWDNTHMWRISCATTWDGENATVYIDKPVSIDGAIVKSLRQLKYDLDDHFEKGGKLLGHNIVAFDLPALRDSMDIYCVRKYLEEKDTRCIDTSRMMTELVGKRVQLDNLAKSNLDAAKSADGLAAVEWWGEGRYEDVAKYCLLDSQLTYNLWKMGTEKREVRYFNEEKMDYEIVKVEW